MDGECIEDEGIPVLAYHAEIIRCKRDKNVKLTRYIEE